MTWRSVGDSQVEHVGRIRFEEASGGTRINVQMRYSPPGGIVGHAVARAFGVDPKTEMDDDLGRMKVAIETGNAPRDDGWRPEQPTLRHRKLGPGPSPQCRPGYERDPARAVDILAGESPRSPRGRSLATHHGRHACVAGHGDAYRVGSPRSCCSRRRLRRCSVLRALPCALPPWPARARFGGRGARALERAGLLRGGVTCSRRARGRRGTRDASPSDRGLVSCPESPLHAGRSPRRRRERRAILDGNAARAGGMRASAGIREPGSYRGSGRSPRRDFPRAASRPTRRA